MSPGFVHSLLFERVKYRLDRFATFLNIGSALTNRNIMFNGLHF